MGWTAQYFTTIIIQGTDNGVFIYNGAPASGSLIGSWAAQAGVDPFGNPYPAGINVFQGLLNGVSISNSSLIASTILQATINGAQITASNIAGGTMTETVVTFDSGGGGLLSYSSSTTTVTLTNPNVTTWTSPVTGNG